MQIRVGFEMAYRCPQPTPMILVLNIHYSRASDLVRPDLLITSPAVPITMYRDLFGNWCSRLVAPPAGSRHHHRVLAQPCTSVDGTVSIEGGRAVPFSGRGYHDHHFGDRPLRRWFRMRVLGNEGVAVLSGFGADRTGPGPHHRGFHAQWTQVDAAGAREWPAQVAFEAARYPATLEVPGGRTLHRPTVLGRSGSVDHIVYDVSGPSARAPGKHHALCEWW